MTDPQVSSTFVEVLGPDRIVYRFAAGTKAGFAVDRISSRLSESIVCIQATKEGEEPVEFGPNAHLVNYGDGWILCTLQSESQSCPKSSPKKRPDISGNQSFNTKHVDPSTLYPGGKLPPGRSAEMTFEYVGKIALCFVFMLLLGTILKTLLEQLPTLQSSQFLASNAKNEL